MELQAIGSIHCGQLHTTITLMPGYEKALKHVDKFSHIHVFYGSIHQGAWELKRQIIAIKAVDIENGQLVGQANAPMSGEGVVFDLKPYFPTEDAVYDIDDTATGKATMIPLKSGPEERTYQVGSIGFIHTDKEEHYIQLESELRITSTYVLVYWWFHKFDSKRYRQVRQCNPPYEKAPRSGIFATRSPVRPNPIAMTVAKVSKVDHVNHRIYLKGLECYENTPCLGLQAYCSKTDCITSCQIPEWLSHWNTRLDERKSPLLTDPEELQDSKVTALLHEENVTASREEERSSCIEDKDALVVRGAREHNLKGITARIPYRQITAVVGVSGSGKSSLVKDTIYAECRRRMEYLTSSRNLLQKPKMDSIHGCTPVVFVSQAGIHGNSLSTVGTYSNAYDYLRILFGTVGVRHCPGCGAPIVPLTKETIYRLLSKERAVTLYNLKMEEVQKAGLAEQIDLALAQGRGAFYASMDGQEPLLLQTTETCYSCHRILFKLTPQTFSYVNPDSRCPICHGTGQMVEPKVELVIEHPERSLLEGASSFYGKLKTFQTNPNANWMKGQVFGLADYLQVDLSKPFKELPDTFKEMLLYGAEDVNVTFTYDNRKNGRKGEITRPVEGLLPILTRLHSEHTEAKSIEKYMAKVTCSHCKGERLAMEGRIVTIKGVRYPEAAAMTYTELKTFLEQVEQSLSEEELSKAAGAIASLKEIIAGACKLGIDYLPLEQSTATLSGGEGQRLRLLGAMLNHMTGLLYIFDEPSKGLHPVDYSKVRNVLAELKEQGNTVVMVEHNEEMIGIADYLIEIGPGAGKLGGRIVGEGSLSAMLANTSTQISKYMQPSVPLPSMNGKQAVEKMSFLTMEGLNYNTLKNLTVHIPKQAITCICGVSGSGKSSLMKGELYPRVKAGREFREVVLVDQQPIGKTSKSIVATYADCMDAIRLTFANSPDARVKNMDARYFSFNGEQGQCPNCKGEGRIKLPYLIDSYITCPDCQGKRFLKSVLEVQLQGKSIDEVLEMSIEEAMAFFQDVNEIVWRLKALSKVGLGYLKLGQSTASLSGGEASRLKLAKELMSQKSTVLYLLDEPTTGLHFSDVCHLLGLLTDLVNEGNTIIAIEHNKAFIKACDWIIELGPGAGVGGGKLLYEGQVK